MLAKASKLDVMFRKLLLTKFFTKGWGTVDNLKRMCEFGKVISDRSKCKHLVGKTYPVYIDKNEQRGDCRVLEGHFLSPFAKYMKGIMPKEVEMARFQVVLPLSWKSDKKPICVHLAGTGDHGFWRRRALMARPLLKEYGIGSIILENPFYGVRKPKEQLRSSLLKVNDLFVMGGALILETLTLLHWCEKEGFGPLGISGISMGGHMATLAATNWHKPIALIPCLSWSNATPTFTEGVMSGAIPWETLTSEYVFHSEYEAEILRKLMKCPQYDAYRLGQEFAANFPESMEELKHISLKSGLQSSTDKPNPSPDNPVQSRGVGGGHAQPSGVAETPTHTGAISEVPSPSDHQQTLSARAPIDQHQSSISETSESPSPSPTSGAFSPTSDCEKIHAINSNDDVRPESSKDSLKSRDVLSTAGIGQPQPCQDSSSSSQAYPETGAGSSPASSAAREEAHGESAKTSRADDPGSKSEAKSGLSKKNLRKARQRDLGNPKAKLKLSKEEYKEVKEDALHFMEGVMDASTFVGNFSKPVDPELVLSVLAEQDGYIPWHQMPSLKELWPGMEVRYVNSGHIAAILFKQHFFRQAINDAFLKMDKKYKGVFPEES